jgi:hypothetical protein
VRNAIWIFALAALCAAGARGQAPKVEKQKDFAASLPAVKAALQNMGAYTGSRLPSLDGFVNLQGIRASDFQRPYYEYKIDLEPSGPKGTVVKVRANVSAWYAGQNGEPAGYRNFESNGRLESDLLDRLSQYLTDKSDDPKVLSENIEKVRAQRAEAEHQVAALSSSEKERQSANGVSATTQFALVAQPHVNVYSAPVENSKSLVHARLDDEFQIVDQHGAWIKVVLAPHEDGWMKRNQVEVAVVSQVDPAQTKKATPGFSIIRQNENEFEGDWQPLKGKKALYLFAQPDGSAMNVATGDRWQFVQTVFSDQYRQIAHSPQNSVEGVVIIFMDQGGGVAAASLDDIRAWMEGGLSKGDFIKRCSLDPPSAFLKSQPAEHTAGKKRSAVSSLKAGPRS